MKRLIFETKLRIHTEDNFLLYVIFCAEENKWLLLLRFLSFSAQCFGSAVQRLK